MDGTFLEPPEIEMTEETIIASQGDFAAATLGGLNHQQAPSQIVREALDATLVKARAYVTRLEAIKQIVDADAALGQLTMEDLFKINGHYIS